LVFRRLAVFPASFSLTSAEVVAADDGVDVLGAVVALVDRSLVQ
jgi:predicted ATPase